MNPDNTKFQISQSKKELPIFKNAQILNWVDKQVEERQHASMYLDIIMAR